MTITPRSVNGRGVTPPPQTTPPPPPAPSPILQNKRGKRLLLRIYYTHTHTHTHTAQASTVRDWEATAPPPPQPQLSLHSSREVTVAAGGHALFDTICDKFRFRIQCLSGCTCLQTYTTNLSVSITSLQLSTSYQEGEGRDVPELNTSAEKAFLHG